jgi:hypothetical protein
MPNDNETTWHDQKPTHSNPPAYVQAYRKAAAEAWRKHDEACERYLAATTESAQEAAMKQMRWDHTDALAADARAASAYARWQAELAAQQPTEPPAPPTVSRLAAIIGKVRNARWAIWARSQNDGHRTSEDAEAPAIQ